MNAPTDMSSVIVPKSDQINADDLIAGPMTITIRDVRINGGQDQPVSIYFEGSDKAFRPCKSMSRVLVQGWGADAGKYIGRSLTLYRDPTVKWAGMEVGGIRISHMSHIEAEKLMMLTATKGSRKPHKVMPLVMEQAGDPAKDAADKIIANIGRAPDLEKLNGYIGGKPSQVIEGWDADRPDLAQAVRQALNARRNELGQGSAIEDDPFAEQDADTPGEDDRLDAFTAELTSATTPEALKAVEERWYAERASITDVDGKVAFEDKLMARKRSFTKGGDA